MIAISRSSLKFTRLYPTPCPTCGGRMAEYGTIRYEAEYLDDEHAREHPIPEVEGTYCVNGCQG